MKRRINLTLDDKLVARARRVAHRQRISISRLVEKGLQGLTKEADFQDKSFAERWAGKLKLSPRNPADRKREHLWRKYRLADDADLD